MARILLAGNDSSVFASILAGRRQILVLAETVQTVIMTVLLNSVHLLVVQPDFGSPEGGYALISAIRQAEVEKARSTLFPIIFWASSRQEMNEEKSRALKSMEVSVVFGSDPYVLLAVIDKLLMGESF